MERPAKTHSLAPRRRWPLWMGQLTMRVKRELALYSDYPNNRSYPEDLEPVVTLTEIPQSRLAGSSGRAYT